MVRPSVLAGGFSLMELMLVVLLIGLLATIAWPTWRSYQVDATSAVLTANVQSMALFQEDYRIRYGSYATNFTDQQQIAEVIGWQLAKNDGSTYAIDPSPGDHYVVRAVAHEGVAVCLIMPAARPCPD